MFFFSPMTKALFLFTLFSSFFTISSSNPIFAVLGFISLFTFTSSYLILLGIGFLGLTYLLIYVGAIAILFLFVVMMINLKFLTNPQFPNFLPLASLIALFFLFSNFSFFFLFDSFTFFFFSQNDPWSSLFNSSNHLTSLAFPLYSSFSLWLLFSSLVLFLAMLAPILLIL
uniref:NADH dehydrogenase subunit 6 n=1 Tax=Capillidium rhysosporum TaxID=181046 RepID=UPI0020C8C7FA|nr:NADH dehydrogenase subunit 6 [Capillidium rhysosporum]QWY25721.1 NADH dehydrogenase subunit 6 [Capillidium rhysosporum]